MGDVVNGRETRVGRENEPTAAGVGVSVVMTTYNENPRYLPKRSTVFSRRRCRRDEIIVVDDGSATRDPAPVLARYPQLTVIRQSHRGSPARATPAGEPRAASTSSSWTRTIA